MKSQLNTTASIKQNNILQVKQTLFKIKTATKPEIAELTGLTSATCGTILNDLVAESTVIQDELRISNGGRPAQAYRLNQQKFMYLCMMVSSEFEKNEIHYQVKDPCENIYKQGFYSFDEINPKNILTAVKKVIRNFPNIQVISLGVQGYVYNDTVEYSDINSIIGLNLAEIITKATHIKTIVENDMNSVVYGYSQKYSDEKNMAVLFLPKNNFPAAGFLVNGNILKGNSNLAGELSYLPFTPPLTKKSFCSVNAALPALLQIIFTTIVFIDPATIIFAGSLSEKLQEISLVPVLQKQFSRVQLPRLIFNPDSRKEYFEGLSHIATEYLLSRSTQDL